MDDAEFSSVEAKFTLESVPGATLTQELISSGLGLVGTHPVSQGHAFLELTLESKGIRNLDLLVNYPLLMYVNLSDNEIDNLEVFGTQSCLMQLVARNNKISKCLEFAAPLCNSENRWTGGAKAWGSQLVNADISYNEIESMGDMSRHTFLKTLMLAHNKITVATGLSSLQYLNDLDLSFNKLTSIEGLLGLNIQELNLEGNQIESLVGLDKLPRLTSLNISSNRIVTLAPLAGCAHLTFLDARKNLVPFIRQLEHLDSLPWLRTLYFYDNPASFKPFYRSRVLYRLHKLVQLDHTPVSAEEKVRAYNAYGDPEGRGDLSERASIFRKYYPDMEFRDSCPVLVDDELGLSPLELESGVPGSKSALDVATAFVEEIILSVLEKETN